MSHLFEKGELVRFRTPHGARVGVIEDVVDDSLTVKSFGDEEQHEVSKSQAVLFSEFLTHRKRRSKLNTVYAEFFGGPPRQRMRSKRVDELCRVLLDHGVQFDDTRRSADDFFSMKMDPAHLTEGERKDLMKKSVLPDAVTAWLPKWLVTDPLPPSSRDPLGLQADAGRLAHCLLPGMTVFTNRVGYYFFLSWALREVNRQDALTARQRRDLLNRLERALVMCETLYHGKEGIRQCFHQGQRVKGRLLAQADRTTAIPDRILKNQHNTGCYNLYRTTMRSCGFWEPDDQSGTAGRLPFRLTPRGERLANAFAKRAGANSLLSWAQDGTKKRKVMQLQRWGESFCFLSFHNVRSEKKPFLDGFLFAKGDSAEVMHDADTRLNTVRTLTNAGRLSTPSPENSVTTMVSTESAGADVTELESGSDGDKQTAPESYTESGENVAFLLHFYRHRRLAGAGPFAAAAVYELLGLALSAVWGELLSHAMEHGRTSLTSWVRGVVHDSSYPQFWNSPVRAAASQVLASEEQLVFRVFTEDHPLENGMMLAVKVLAQEDNRTILHDQLPDVALRPIVERAFLSNSDNTVETALLSLIPLLIEQHRTVSNRKSKERWLDTDGSEVWEVDAYSMALGFHSYRFPQLMSLVRDLELTAEDLENA